jgi:hypothetical protein
MSQKHTTDFCYLFPAVVLQNRCPLSRMGFKKPDDSPNTRRQDLWRGFRYNGIVSCSLEKEGNLPFSTACFAAEVNITTPSLCGQGFHPSQYFLRIPYFLCRSSKFQVVGQYGSCAYSRFAIKITRHSLPGGSASPHQVSFRNRMQASASGSTAGWRGLETATNRNGTASDLRLE